MSELKSSGKPFDISKREVWEAYEQVKANRGGPGVDGVTLEGFETDLKNNLYKIWNRLSSGSYFPPPVKAVQIPKPHGGGVRILGVPTIGDRIAQTVVARRLEGKVEPIFHPDSYGYRPNRSALDAVAACRRRCWKYDWAIDLDVQAFFDSVDHDLMIKAVEANTSFTFLGYTFRARAACDRGGNVFTAFLPAISKDALTRLSQTVRRWRLHRRTELSFADLAKMINPIVRGWMQYYGAFYRSAMSMLLARINTYLVRWTRKKYKRLRPRKKARAAWERITNQFPRYFAHWAWVTNPLMIRVARAE